MDDLPRRKLAEIVRRYGTSICEDARRCQALLMDLCGEYRREIFVLTSAVEEGVAAELQKVQSGVPLELLFERLTERLIDNRALDEEAARWAVESWALALGIQPPSRPARRPRPAAPGPKVDDQQLAALMRRAATLDRLELLLAHGNVTDAGLAHLAALPNLVVLDLYECTRVTDRGLTYLRGLTRLTSLDLTGTQVTDLGLSRLTTLKALTSLDLSWCAGITDAGLAYLRAFTHLTSLGLSKTRVTDAGLAHLHPLAGLAELELYGCDITDRGVDHLSGLAGLTHLSLEACEGITDRGLAHLRGLQRLAVLNLQGCRRVTRRGVQALRRSGREIWWP